MQAITTRYHGPTNTKGARGVGMKRAFRIKVRHAGKLGVSSAQFLAVADGWTDALEHFHAWNAENFFLYESRAGCAEQGVYIETLPVIGAHPSAQAFRRVAAQRLKGRR